MSIEERMIEDRTKAYMDYVELLRNHEQLTDNEMIDQIDYYSSRLDRTKEQILRDIEVMERTRELDKNGNRMEALQTKWSELHKAAKAFDVETTKLLEQLKKKRAIENATNRPLVSKALAAFQQAKNDNDESQRLKLANAFIFPEVEARENQRIKLEQLDAKQRKEDIERKNEMAIEARNKRNEEERIAREKSRFNSGR